MNSVDWHAQAAVVLAATETMLRHAEAQDWSSLAEAEAERKPALARLLPAPAAVDPVAVLAFVEAVLASDRCTARLVGESRDEAGQALRGLMAAGQARRAYGGA